MVEFVRGQPRNKTRVNLTPLIDVIFLLIIFFLMSSDFITFGNVDIDMVAQQETDSADPPAENSSIIVSLTQDEMFRIADQQRSISELSGRLSELLKRSPNRQIILRSQEGVVVQDMISAIEQVQIAGGKKLAVEASDKASIQANAHDNSPLSAIHSQQAAR